MKENPYSQAEDEQLDEILANYTAMLLDIPRKQVIPDSLIGQEIAEAKAAINAYTTNKINEARIELVNYFMDASYANNGDMDDMVVPLDVVLAHLTPEKALNHRKDD